MSYSASKFEAFASLLEQKVADLPNNQIIETAVSGFHAYKGTYCKTYPAVYDPAIIILSQGKKIGRIGKQEFDLSVGRSVSIFVPIAWEVEVIEASEEKPLIMSGVKMDLGRIANILMKMDRIAPLQTPPEPTGISGVYSDPLNDEILDTLIRLLHMMDRPVELEVLGDSILDELYFRLICNDRSGSLQRLLHHRGQIPQISRAVNHIHNHLDQVVSVNDLADLVNMSPSGFRKVFRDVMHMPPLQYAKSIKLDRAQLFIRNGKNANEAGYMVGYNSPAQFSREYKRHFGYSPSQTVAA